MWIKTRLRASVVPSKLIDELMDVYETINDPTQQSELVNVLGSFGLRIDIQDTLEPLPPVSLSPDVKFPSSLGRKFSLKNKSLAFPSKWLSHRRQGSNSSKPTFLPSAFSPDRRPSLPDFSTTSLLHPFSTSRTRLSTVCGDSAPGPSSTNDRKHYPIRLSAPPEITLSSPNLLASVLESADPRNIRQIVVHHFLAMQYNISADPSDDWYLGEGRIVAERLFSDIQATLEANHGSVPELSDLPTLFGLDRAIQNDCPEDLRTLLSDEFGGFPCPPPRMSMSTTDLRSRATSFDLDRYFDDITEAGDEDLGIQPVAEFGEADINVQFKRHSTDTLVAHRHRCTNAGLDSLLTVATGKTGRTANSRYSETRGHPSSSHASFTIQQATRGWIGSPVKLVKSRRVRSVDIRSTHSGNNGQRGITQPAFDILSCDDEGEDDGSDVEHIIGEEDAAIDSDLDDFTSATPFTRKGRFSRSEADLPSLDARDQGPTM